MCCRTKRCHNYILTFFFPEINLIAKILSLSLLPIHSSDQFNLCTFSFRKSRQQCEELEVVIVNHCQRCSNVRWYNLRLWWGWEKWITKRWNRRRKKREKKRGRKFHENKLPQCMKCNFVCLINTDQWSHKIIDLVIKL